MATRAIEDSAALLSLVGGNDTIGNGQHTRAGIQDGAAIAEAGVTMKNGKTADRQVC